MFCRYIKVCGAFYWESAERGKFQMAPADLEEAAFIKSRTVVIGHDSCLINKFRLHLDYERNSFECFSLEAVLCTCLHVVGGDSDLLILICSNCQIIWGMQDLIKLHCSYLHVGLTRLTLIFCGFKKTSDRFMIM